MLDAERGDLRIHLCRHCRLRRLDFRAPFGRGADDVECPPGQHAGNRVQVRSIDVATDAGRLKGDRPAAAEGVRQLRPMAKAGDTKLLHQLGQAAGIRSQMRIHARPDRVQQGALVHFFGPLHHLQPRFDAIGQGRQRLGNCGLTLMMVKIVAPARAEQRLATRVVESDRYPRFALAHGTDEVPHRSLKATPEGRIVHRHQRQEDIKIGGRVFRRGQKATQRDGPAQDQWLAPLPIAAKRSQRLPRACLPLFIGLRRQPPHGEHGFDQAWGILERKRGKGHQISSLSKGGVMHA